MNIHIYYDIMNDQSLTYEIVTAVHAFEYLCEFVVKLVTFFAVISCFNCARCFIMFA